MSSYTKGTTVTYKEIIKLSLPIIAASAIENLTAIINTAFLGRVGPIALGAIAIGGIFYLALVMIGFGFGIGTQIIVARRYGEKDFNEIGRTIYHAAIFLLSMAVFIFFIVQSYSGTFFNNILKSHEVIAEVKAFMSYRIFGIMFAFTNLLFRAFYIGIQRTRIIGISSFIIAMVNIFCDFSLIFGHFGFPEMGVAGAGLASVIAEIAGTIFFVSYTSKRHDVSEFWHTNNLKFSFSLLKRIFKIANPVMLQFSISFGGWFIFFLLVEKMGEMQLAVSNIIRTYYMIVLLPVWGYASTTNTLVSYKMGSKSFSEIIPLVKKIIGLSIITVVILVFITDIFSHYIIRIYTNNPVLIKACYPVLVVVSISSILVTVAIILFNIVSGSGKTKVCLIIEFVVICIYVAWTYLLVHIEKATIAQVWTAEILYGLVMGFISFLYLKFGNWRKSIV